MTDPTKKILDEALKLPAMKRAILAAELTGSLDAEDEDTTKEAWLEEIERRVRRSMAGEVEASDWKSVRARVEQRVRRARRA